MTAVSSMRLFVVCAALPPSSVTRPSGLAITTPHPPGPGFPSAAPSVKMMVSSPRRRGGAEAPLVTETSESPRLRGEPSAFQRLEFDAVRPIRIAVPPAQVRLVVLIVPFEPLDVTVALEGEDVRRDAIEEPAVVRDHDHAAGKAEQR